MNRTVRKILIALTANEDQAQKYRKLSVQAHHIGLPDEATRCTRLALELEADSDDMRDQLLALGYNPDDDERNAV